MKVLNKKEICPFCKEEITPGALVCKHCHSIIKLPPQQKKVPAWRNKFLLGFYTGVIFMGVLIYLYTKIFKLN